MGIVSFLRCPAKPPYDAHHKNLIMGIMVYLHPRYYGRRITVYLNKMIMNRLFHTCKQLIGVAALSVELYACDWIHDDSLPLCEFRLYFKYDYNMKFADAFQHEVDFVTLFFCDQEGNFLFLRRIEKSELDERNSIAGCREGARRQGTYLARGRYDTTQRAAPALA